MINDFKIHIFLNFLNDLRRKTIKTKVVLQRYFSANEQCFSLTADQHKYKHKSNFSETNRASTGPKTS